jgi:hypothetical protein
VSSSWSNIVAARTLPESSIVFALNAGGAAAFRTTGSSGAPQAGYASIDMRLGAFPYATAVFSLKQNGVTISEAGVPASPPTTSARIFIDNRSGILAVPARSEAGTININTGIALVNYSSASANVTYTLRDMNGNLLSTGHGIVAARNHFSCFIDQLRDVNAPDFTLPADFQTAIQFASLDIISDQPLSVLALRGTSTQRNEFLITTVPVADLTQSLESGPLYFPQLANGGGYTTSLVLMNTSNQIETGRIKILDDYGESMGVTLAGGSTDSSFRYTILSGGALHIQTNGSPVNVRTGWIQVIPDLYNPTPAGSAIFGYNPEDVLVSESGIPSAVPTTHARVYVDLSNNHNTGLAIANVIDDDAAVVIRAFRTDGVTAAGINIDMHPLKANGHVAAFADQFIAGLPAGFVGVLDISSVTPFAALTLRSMLNERNDFLMTTFPIADANRTVSLPIVFPQIADGGGYVTQFIFLGAGAQSAMALNFYGGNGTPLIFGK